MGGCLVLYIGCYASCHHNIGCQTLNWYVLVGFGILWDIPATADYVDRVVAALLLFFFDALQGHVRCATTIIESAGNTSKLILASMHKVTYKRFYQVMAVLGLVLLYTYITLAFLFIVVATMIAYEYLQSPPVSWSS